MSLLLVSMWAEDGVDVNKAFYYDFVGIILKRVWVCALDMAGSNERWCKFARINFEISIGSNLLKLIYFVFNLQHWIASDAIEINLQIYSRNLTPRPAKIF